MAERGEEETPIQIITVTEDQCGYCLESGTRRVDPRRLPCGHSFCLLCLTDDFARINAVRCPVCRFVYISESDLQYVKLNIIILEVLVQAVSVQDQINSNSVRCLSTFPCYFESLDFFLYLMTSSLNYPISTGHFETH